MLDVGAESLFVDACLLELRALDARRECDMPARDGTPQGVAYISFPLA